MFILVLRIYIRSEQSEKPDMAGKLKLLMKTGMKLSREKSVSLLLKDRGL